MLGKKKSGIDAYRLGVLENIFKPISHLEYYNDQKHLWASKLKF